MSVGFKSYLPLCALSVALLTAVGQAHAGPQYIKLDDFQANCDIRSLNLTQDQHNALRRIRNDYKQASDKAYRKLVRTDRNRRQVIMKILAADKFDQNNARDYVETRYLSSMDSPWKNWKSNTASTTCSIRANANFGSLPAFADISLS